jgi:hypothetical protein
MGRNLEEGPVGIHVCELTVGMLADASRAARRVDHTVVLIDDLAHLVVLVDQRGRVVVRREKRQFSPDQ